jgi:hypothetical protein
MTVARMSFFGAWMAVLAGEMAGINSGLGVLIMFGQQQFNMSRLPDTVRGRKAAAEPACLTIPWWSQFPRLRQELTMPKQTMPSLCNG